jgi:hypothetical protein
MKACNERCRFFLLDFGAHYVDMTIKLGILRRGPVIAYFTSVLETARNTVRAAPRDSASTFFE